MPRQNSQVVYTYSQNIQKVNWKKHFYFTCGQKIVIHAIKFSDSCFERANRGNI